MGLIINEQGLFKMENMASDNSSHEQQAAQAIQERLFKQAELNEIVGRAKHEAVESYKRQSAATASHQPHQEQPQSLSEEAIRRITAEELYRQREEFKTNLLKQENEESAKKIVTAYQQKLKEAVQKYGEFDAVNAVDISVFPNVVQHIIEDTDNAEDVLYSLASKPSKLLQLQMLSERSPTNATYEIKRLSKALKAQETIPTLKQAKPPLNQQSSSSSGKDVPKAQMTIADFKELFSRKRTF
jgi:hypothetical protein